MKRLACLLFLLILAAYAVGAAVFPYEFTTRDVLHQVYTLTGMMLWALMTLCIVSAARPRWIEKAAGVGLNRIMAMHRALGWGVTAFIFLHMLSPVIGWPIPATPVPLMGHHDMSTVWKAAWIISHPICAFGGTLVAFWILWIVWKDSRRRRQLLSWTKWEPAHRLWAWGYLLMAPHCLRLLKDIEMVMPLGWVNLVMTVIGVWAAVRLLRKGPGADCREAGEEVSVEASERRTWLVVKTPLASRMTPGQFAYLSLPGDKELPHPFSVAAIDAAAGTLGFWVKPAGEWTAALSGLKAGAALTVEGPWGDFRIPEKGEAVWAAAGSGIAPFLSWLEERSRRLSAGESLNEARLFWCIHDSADETGLRQVQRAAEAAQVPLTLFVTSKAGRRPTADDLGLASAQTLSVCGAAGFSKTLQRAWKALGKPTGSFQSEAF